MLLVIEVRPAHYKWRLGNIGRSINDRCRPASAGPSKMGYFQDSWSHVQWRNLLKGLKYLAVSGQPSGTELPHSHVASTNPCKHGIQVGARSNTGLYCSGKDK